MRKAILALSFIGLVLSYCVTAYPDTLILQPDDADGKDARIAANQPDNNFGNGSELTQSILTVPDNRGLLEFGLGSISGMTINSATLSLFHLFNGVSGSSFGIYKLTSAWTESTVTWNTRPGAVSDPDSTLNIADSNSSVWRNWDITSLVQGWASDAYDNYGVMLRRIDNINPVAYFASSDYTNNTYDPKLTVDYSEGQGQPQAIPEPASLSLLGLGLLPLLGFRKKGKAA